MRPSSHVGPLLDARTLPELPAEPRVRSTRPVRIRDDDGRRVQAYIAKVIANLEKAAPGSRNAALNHAAWTLGRWVAAGVLEQIAVEDGLYAAAERNGLVADDGPRQSWATIRSGLSKGLREPKDLEAFPTHTFVSRNASSRHTSPRRPGLIMFRAPRPCPPNVGPRQFALAEDVFHDDTQYVHLGRPQFAALRLVVGDGGSRRRWGVPVLALLLVISVLPVHTGYAHDEQLTIANPSSRLAIQDGELYVGVGSSIQAFSLADPGSPAPLRRLDESPGRVWSLAVGSHYLYATLGAGGVAIIDASDAAHLAEVGRWATAAGHIATTDHYVYAATGDRFPDGASEPYDQQPASELAIVDVADPRAPRQVESYKPKGGVLGVTAAPGYLFVSTDDGVHILSTADPAHPVEVGFASTGGSNTGAPYQVAVVANRMYVGFRFGHLADLLECDISDRSHPGDLEDSRLGAGVLSATDAYLYFTPGLQMLGGSTVSIYPLGSDQPPGVIRLSESPSSLLAADRYLYVASLNGLQVIDIPDPSIQPGVVPST